MRRNWLAIALLLFASAVTNRAVTAQESATDPSAAPSETAQTDAAPEETIASAQEGLAMRYQRFESTMLQVAEYLRKTDPERADLLVRAIGKSKESRLPDQFKLLVNLLKQDQLGDALEEQQHVVVLMQGLLELLQSEDRKEDLEREKQRIRDLIKDVDRLIGKQGDLRSDTERKENPNGLENRQGKIAGDTKKLIDKIDGQDAAKAAAKAAKSQTGKQQPGKQQPGKSGEKSQGEKEAGKDDESKDDEQKPGDEKQSDDAEKKDPDSKDAEDKDQQDGNSKPGKGQKSKDGQKGKDSQQGKDNDKPKEDQPKEDQPKEDEQPSADGKPSESKDSPKGKPKKSQPQQGKQSGQPMPGDPPESDDEQPSPSGQEQENAPSQQSKTPGREELQRAKEEMERAIEELKKKNHGKASDEQDKALNELAKAKEKLEEILRQLREEERELVLAALEARFRDMLARQLEVYNETVGLHAVPKKQRTDRHQSRSVELARKEETIALLAAKALTLLREEGSSIAFPEAVEQMRDDMLNVVGRLERFDVADLTQGIERDIIEALEELVEALQKEIEKSKDKKQNPQSQEQQPQEQALVNILAELKTLRSLQHRVNRRTKILGREVDGEQAVDPEVVKQLREQARRQEKIQKATYDLSTGRNK